MSHAGMYIQGAGHDQFEMTRVEMEGVVLKYSLQTFYEASKLDVYPNARQCMHCLAFG